MIDGSPTPAVYLLTPLDEEVDGSPVGSMIFPLFAVGEFAGATPADGTLASGEDAFDGLFGEVCRTSPIGSKGMSADNQKRTAITYGQGNYRPLLT